MKKNFLKIFIFIMIIFLTPKVFAQDFTVSDSNITSPNSGGTGKYTGTEIYNTGSSNVYNMNTRYNGRLSRIVFNLSPGGYAETTSNFDLDKTYTLTLNMATDDWRNNFGSVSVKCNGSSGTELSNGRVNYITYRKINFSFTTGSNTCGFVYVDLKSSNIVSTAFTGVSNWNLSSMVITDPTYGSGGSGGSGGGSSGSSNQDIIDSNTANTNNIINNNTNNTNNIIENNNQNTQAINDAINNSTSKVVEGIDSINSQLGTCYKNMLNLRSPLTISTATYSFSGNNITYTGSWNNVSWDIPITSSGYYTLAIDNNLPTNAAMMVYYVKPDGERTDWLADIPSGSNHVSLFSNYNTGFLRIILYDTSNSSITFTLNNLRFTNTNSVMPFSRYNETICTSKLDNTTSAINDVNDSINNSNVDSGVGTDFFNDFEDNSHGLTGIITAPLTAIQSITSSTCQPLTIPIPFTNGSVNLPCMTEIYEQNIPTIYNIWKIVSFGIIAYFICIDIFHIVKGFKDPETDKVEVLDL